MDDEKYSTAAELKAWITPFGWTEKCLLTCHVSQLESGSWVAEYKFRRKSGGTEKFYVPDHCVTGDCLLESTDWFETVVRLVTKYPQPSRP